MPEPRDVREMIRGLRALRARLRAVLTAQRTLLIAAASLAALVVLAILDFALRLPDWIRWTNWIIGVAALILAVARYVWPAASFRPSLTDLALRVERAAPDLRGLLASAVDFARADEAHPAGPIDRALRADVMSRAARAWSPSAASALLDLRAAWRSAGLAAAATAACAALFALAPHLAPVGLARTAAPWLGADWPKRSLVVDATDLTVHPLGAAAPLRAALARSPRDAEEARVSVQYRAIDERGEPGPARNALLTHQRRTVGVRVPTRTGFEDVNAPLFERLIEVDAHALEYRFRSLDDETEWRRIRLVPPPRIESARAVITPPEYAAGLSLGEGGELGTRVEAALGAGADERAVAPASLVGSAIELELTLNKPVPVPEGGEDRRDWIARTLGGDALDAGAEVDAQGERITVRWTADRSVRMPVVLVDAFGIESVDEAVFRFEAVEDRAPSATVTAPAADEAVLPTAIVQVEGEGRDDVGLSRVWLDRRIARPAGEGERSGPGGAVEPGDPAVLSQAEPAGQRAARVAATLELRDTGVAPGDEVWITALAADALADGAGLREPTRSAVRRLLIIDESELIERIQNDLAAIRQSAIRIDEQQAQTSDRLRELGPDEGARRGQSQVGERLARQREAVQRLAERVERNALQDPRLDLLLQEAERRLNEAGRASGEASRTLDDAGERAERDSQDPADAMRDDERAQAERAQERVRDELADLVELLDAGQDTWVTRRRIEQLLNQQRQNLDATRQQQRDTAGLSPEELSRQQREDLQDIVRSQEELAGEAQRLTDELPEKADELEQSDPAAAAGLEQAARSARENRLSERMREAAQQAQENRVADSARSQEQAAEALEQLLEELDRGEQSRRDELRRLLADLVQSIESLVRTQEGELAALAEAAALARQLETLAPAMSRLHRNTLAVADQARAGGAEAAGVVRALERAATEQIAAIGALRAAPPDAPAAQAAEERSLARLNEALEEARRAQDQQDAIEQARRRAELRNAYREALQRQQAVREATRPFEGAAQVTRRDRASLRAVGEEQDAIGDALEELRRAAEELADAAVFDYAHRRLDESIAGSANALREGAPDSAAPPQERALALLRAVLKALDDSQRSSEEQFAQAGGAGQSGQQGQQQQEPLIPPAAELRLLREIQADLALRTRADARAAPERVEALGVEQNDLAALGRELLQRLQQQAAGGAEQPEQIIEPAPEEQP